MATKTYDWSAIVERLHHHRERLGIDKDEMRRYIMETYHKPFMHLSDSEVIALGKTLKEAKHKDDLLKVLPQAPEVR